MKDVKQVKISDIKNPHDLASLTYPELEALASNIREEIINSTSKNGGHLSSNLGVVELTMALHRNFDFSKDKLLFDVGHQSYTHKLLTNRDISKLRSKEGVSGFIKSKESPYDIFEAGHSSTSLSAALAFALDRDNKKENYNVVSLIGDASIANGVALEALNNIPDSKSKVIIILNDNEMAISTPVGGLSNFFRFFQTSKSYKWFKSGFKKTFGVVKPIYKSGEKAKNWIKRHLIATNIFDGLGYIYIGMIDGHDFKALDKALKKAKKLDGPVIVHVRTTKGKGYEYAENDKHGNWHGVNPFDITTGKPINSNKDKVTWSELYSNLVVDRLNRDNKFYLICPGTLTGSALIEAKEKYPDRVIDTGISEEHAVILASNLAKLGYNVCVSIYSTFMQRAFDQISHDLARIHSRVTFLVDRSGLVGSDGDTHQGIYDEAFLMSTPNINVAMATDPNDACALFNESFKCKESTFIRYPRDYVSTKEINNRKYKLLPYNKLITNNNVNTVIVSVGPLTNELKNLLIGMKVDLINPIILKPIDNSLVDILKKYSKIVIYTPYETSYGYSLALTGKLLERGFKGSVLRKAIPLEFIEHATIEEQLQEFGLTPKQMKEFIKNNL